MVVTGQFGFTVASNPVNLANPAAITVGTSVTNDDLTVTASGGTGVLEYSINGIDFQSSNEFIDLANGVYTLTVQDENGCTVTAQATVAVSNLEVNVNVEQEVTCNAGNDGEISVTAIGGQMPYTYSLNGGQGQSSNVFSGLAPGSYTVVVTDNAGAVASSIQIVLADPVAITASAVAITNDIIVTASGGTGTLEYSINGTTFQTNNQFSNVANGTYTVTVQDSKGCTATAQVTVNVAPLTLQVSVVHLLCFGDQNGSITVTASGGIPFYAYSLNGGNFQSNPTFSNLSAGFYNVTVKDFEGNLVTEQNVAVISPSQLFVDATVTTNDVTVNIFGGTSPYTFASDAPNPDLQNLPNGTYHVTATDANGCTAVETFTVDYIVLSATSNFFDITPCDGLANLEVTAAGGTPPYEYSLNNGAFQGSNEFLDLPSGTYTVVVRDAVGDTFTLPSVTLNTASAPNATASASGNTITVNASGGSSPYIYSLNGGAPQSSNVFSGLTPGTYSVVVTDANGCTASVTGIVVVSGTVEPSEAWGFAVSPNPSAGLFELSLQNAPDALRVQVFDATGRLVQSREFHPAGGQFNATLDLQDLPQGTYLLRLSDGENWGGVRLSKLGGR